MADTQILTRRLRAAARSVQRAYSSDGNNWPKPADGWRLDIAVDPVGDQVRVVVALEARPAPAWHRTLKPHSDLMRCVWSQGAPAPPDVPILGVATATPRLSAVFAAEDGGLVATTTDEGRPSNAMTVRRVFAPEGGLEATVVGLQVGHDVATDEDYQSTVATIQRVYASDERTGAHIVSILDEARAAAVPSVLAAAQALSQRRLSSFLMAVVVEVAMQVGATVVELDDSSSRPGIYGRMLGESPRFRQDEDDASAWRLSLIGPGADTIVPRLLARVEAAARPGVLTWQSARKRGKHA
jgi:hypothetical protein